MGKFTRLNCRVQKWGEDKRKSTCKYDMNKHAFRVSGLHIIELLLQNEETKLAMLQRNLEFSAKQNDCHRVQCSAPLSTVLYLLALLTVTIVNIQMFVHMKERHRWVAHTLTQNIQTHTNTTALSPAHSFIHTIANVLPRLYGVCFHVLNTNRYQQRPGEGGGSRSRRGWDYSLYRTRTGLLSLKRSFRYV
jgi:hypothetical protein